MTPDPSAAPPSDDRPRIPCFACAELVLADAKKCRWCGEWYAALPEPYARLVGPGGTAADIADAECSMDGETRPSAVISDEDNEITQAMLSSDAIALEVGPQLARLADPDESGELLERLKDIRHHTVTEFGVIVPDVRVRPLPELAPAAYVIRIKGDLVHAGEVGVGADALRVVSTHVNEVVKQHLADLLTREEVAELLNMARQDAPMVVQELVPNMLALGQIRQVLQNLVREQVSIRDLSTILNALADYAVYTKDPHALTEHVRQALGRKICARYQSPDGLLRAFMLSPDAERAVQNAIQLNETGQVLMLDPQTSNAIQRSLTEELERAQGIGDPVVIVPPKIRRHVKALLERTFATVAVLSYAEIVPGIQVDTIATIEAHGAVGQPERGEGGQLHASSAHSGWAAGSAVVGRSTSTDQSTDVTTSATDTGWLVDPDDPEAPPFPPSPPGSDNENTDWNW
ncbi:MAG: flagellar biosynthesis protein FlhA [Thermoleophilia bacterium]|nr:flagellar biosynthesis protein FlhA [Thermoleophilia bacterium]